MVSAAVILDGREPQAGVSHVIGGVTSPLIEDTIPAVLKDTAARFGDRDAAIFPPRISTGPMLSSTIRSTGWQAVYTRSVSVKATGSAYGRQTALNGCSRSSRPRGLALFWSISILLIGFMSLNMC